VQIRLRVAFWKCAVAIEKRSSISAPHWPGMLSRPKHPPSAIPCGQQRNRKPGHISAFFRIFSALASNRASPGSRWHRCSNRCTAAPTDR